MKLFTVLVVLAVNILALSNARAQTLDQTLSHTKSKIDRLQKSNRFDSAQIVRIFKDKTDTKCAGNPSACVLIEGDLFPASKPKDNVLLFRGELNSAEAGLSKLASFAARTQLFCGAGCSGQVAVESSAALVRNLTRQFPDISRVGNPNLYTFDVAVQKWFEVVQDASDACNMEQAVIGGLRSNSWSYLLGKNHFWDKACIRIRSDQVDVAFDPFVSLSFDPTVSMPYATGKLGGRLIILSVPQTSIIRNAEVLSQIPNRPGALLDFGSKIIPNFEFEREIDAVFAIDAKDIWAVSNVPMQVEH